MDPGTVWITFWAAFVVTVITPVLVISRWKRLEAIYEKTPVEKQDKESFAAVKTTTIVIVAACGLAFILLATALTVSSLEAAMVRVFGAWALLIGVGGGALFATIPDVHAVARPDAKPLPHL